MKKRTKQKAIIIDLFDQFTEYPLKDIYFYKSKFIKPIRLKIFTDTDFTFICFVVSQIKNLCLIVDEVDFFDDPIRPNEYWRRLIHYSRHYNIDIITTSRRPHNISRDLTSQTDLFCLFQITEPRDLVYLANLDMRLPNIVKSLPIHKYIKYDFQNISDQYTSYQF